MFSFLTGRSRTTSEEDTTKSAPPLFSIADTPAAASFNLRCNETQVANEFFSNIFAYLSETGGCFLSGSFMIEDPGCQILKKLGDCRNIESNLRNVGAVTHSTFKMRYFNNRGRSLNNSSNYYAGTRTNFEAIRHSIDIYNKNKQLIGERMIEFELNNESLNLKCELIYKTSLNEFRRYEENFQKKTMNFYPVFIIDKNTYTPEVRSRNPFRQGDRVYYEIGTGRNINKHTGTVINVNSSGAVEITRDTNNMTDTINSTQVKGLYEFIFVKLETTSSKSAEHALNAAKTYGSGTNEKTKIFLPKRSENESNPIFDKLERNDIDAVKKTLNMLTEDEAARAESRIHFYNQFIRASQERFIPASLLKIIMKGPSQWHSSENTNIVRWENIPLTKTPPSSDDTILHRRTTLVHVTNNGPVDKIHELETAAFGRRKKMIPLETFVKKYKGSRRKALLKYQLAIFFFENKFFTTKK